ncbi:hypothetical protein H1V43_39610 [Streptomyces sp. PSKA54]|uniref:Uncharacterized protein n=1 Tax=Streptomyces himalayensis subsp. aureolus TaxID=2758039 RepID=A0A7W2D9U5_9ACTN|nr:hypothetical protein [Streptomyces himalayensis]MBA4867277.1 hypothetical protein [Streptomyces himalayensis subsp. aureolus]
MAVDLAEMLADGGETIPPPLGVSWPTSTPPQLLRTRRDAAGPAVLDGVRRPFDRREVSQERLHRIDRLQIVPQERPTSPSESFRIAESWMYDDAGAGTSLGAEAALARCVFLEWGECTDEVTAFAFPNGDRVHLACRIRDGGGAAWGTEARREPTVVSVSRTLLVETLEHGLVIAEHEWSARLAAIKARSDTCDDGDVSSVRSP